MNSRIKQLAAVFHQHKIEAFLVTKDINIAYLTGFPACESWLLVGLRRACYITDFRYVDEARKELKGIRVQHYTKLIAEALFKVIKETGVKRIGIDGRHLTLSQYQMLEHWCPKDVRLIRVDDLVEDFRKIKDQYEIKQVKKALRIHKQAHQFLKRIIRPNISEKKILLKLENFVRSRGAGFAFEPIIASGVNSCYPHARVTEREIRAHEPLLIDMGIDVEGYKSDLTRMFFLGRIPALVRQIHDAVYETQKRTIAQIKDGVSAADVDRIARNYLAKKGLAKYFGHALGHGIGLEVHEAPCLAQNNSSLLKEGMIITVEPAVYIPKKFGVRIEDMVLVKKKNCEILSDDIH